MFPWLIGHVSTVIGVPAWRLLGIADTLATSGVVLASFLLWRRLLSDGVASAVALASFAVFLQPAKPYEVMALAIMIP